MVNELFEPKDPTIREAKRSTYGNMADWVTQHDEQQENMKKMTTHFEFPIADEGKPDADR